MVSPRFRSAYAGCVLAALILLFSASAGAELTGQLYLSFAPDHIDNSQVIRPGEIFTYYLVAELPEDVDGLIAFECTVRLSPDILFTGLQLQPLFPGPINVAPGWTGDGMFQFAVGGGGCIDAEHFPLPLAQFQGLVLEATEELYSSVGPGIDRWTSNGGIAPAWVACSEDVIRDFAVPEDGQKIQPILQTVATTSHSFGAVRALYREEVQQ